MATPDIARRPGHVPLDRSRLIGREDERAAASVLLLDEAVPLLTLTGPGGVGKTRLALAIAADAGERFADGVACVDLASLTAPALIEATVAASMGVSLAADTAPIDALVEQMRPRQCLLLLDNCEHVLVPIATVSSVLLTSCPALQILATSRVPLRIRGEQILPVSPLAVPEPGVDALDAIASAPAVALFTQRARAIDPAFSLRQGNADAVAEICRTLDGLPLALELAAARLSVLTPVTLLDLLHQHNLSLGTGARDAPIRHKTLHSAIAWSYDLLSSEEQAFFRRLAVFAGGWTLESAASVCELPIARAVDLHAVLVEQSLIVREAGSEGSVPRFTMLETIRTFGIERLRATSEDQKMRDRHAAYFQRLVSRLELHAAAPADASWLQSVTPEEANLRLALEWFQAQGNILALSELSSGLTVLWETGSRFSEGRYWLELAIANDAHLPASLRARGREAAGLFIGYCGDNAIAMPILEDAVALATECNDPILLRHALFSLGIVVLADGDHARAMALQEAAEHAARMASTNTPDAPNSGLFVGLTLYAQGVAAQRGGDDALALVRFAAAEPFLRAPGGNRRLGMMLGERGVIQLQGASIAAAAATLLESIGLTWGVRNVAAITRALRGMAVIAARTSQPASGALLLGAADAIDASTPHASVAINRDRDIIALCQDSLAGIANASFVNQQRHAGFALSLEQAVALGRGIARMVLGTSLTEEIWHGAGAPDPGPMPSPGRDMGQSPLSPHAVQAPLLTQRQREVLVLLCQRRTDLEIAAELFISPRTANRHVAAILAKLDAANRRDAAANALRMGLM